MLKRGGPADHLLSFVSAPPREDLRFVKSIALSATPSRQRRSCFIAAQSAISNLLAFWDGLQSSLPPPDARTSVGRRSTSTRDMAPDINSLPASPRADRQPPTRMSSDYASRRTSTQMPPPPPPVGPAAHRSPTISSNEQLGLPLRHPRPLTAAELYLECEKEQEAVVWADPLLSACVLSLY